VRLTIDHPRLAPAPLEGRSIVARFDAYTQGLEVVIATQFPHADRQALSSVLGIPEHKIRIITRDVGGGFGAKGTVYAEEAIVAYFALKLRTSAGWTETRSEGLCAMYHGRGYRCDVTMGVRADGAITALDIDARSDVGAFMSPVAAGPPTNVVNM